MRLRKVAIHGNLLQMKQAKRVSRTLPLLYMCGVTPKTKKINAKRFNETQIKKVIGSHTQRLAKGGIDLPNA